MRTVTPAIPLFMKDLIINVALILNVFGRQILIRPIGFGVQRLPILGVSTSPGLTMKAA